MRAPVAQRFWKYVLIKDAHECWEWTGCMHPSGYGWFQDDNGATRAHRVAFRLTAGEIPKGLWVLHTCDNRKCVNPGHLYLGTLKENTEDARARKRFATGERNASSKLSAFAVKNIRRLRAAGWKQSELAEAYSVTQSRISEIVSGKSWSHL